MSNILQSRKFNWIWASSMIIVLIIGSIFSHSFNRTFYNDMNERLSTAQRMNLSESELNTATAVLLDYIQDSRNDLHFELESGDQMFNQKEIDHMVDVKNLYLGSQAILYVSLIVAIFLTIRYLSLGLKKAKFIFNQSFKTSFVVFGLLLAALGMYVVFDFDGFWTNFHHVFFSNDLWLLDPAADRLIQMVPLEFFNQLVFRIIFSVLIGLIILAFIALYQRKANHPKLHIVLFEPEIPQNTGNVMRTAMASNATLHLIEPFGFIYDDKRLKRSGMDYIDELDIIIHDDYAAFKKTVNGRVIFVTRYGEQSHSEINYSAEKENIYLVFGKESTGLPLDVLSNNLKDCVRIPMTSNARSLNLANSVAIVTYEVLRQLDYQELSLVEIQKGSDWLRKHK